MTHVLNRTLARANKKSKTERWIDCASVMVPMVVPGLPVKSLMSAGPVIYRYCRNHHPYRFAVLFFLYYLLHYGGLFSRLFHVHLPFRPHDPGHQGILR